MWTCRAGILCKGTVIRELLQPQSVFLWNRGVNTWAYLTDVLANRRSFGGIWDSWSRPDLNTGAIVQHIMSVQWVSESLWRVNIYVKCGEKVTILKVRCCERRMDHRYPEAFRKILQFSIWMKDEHWKTRTFWWCMFDCFICHCYYASMIKIRQK